MRSNQPSGAGSGRCGGAQAASVRAICTPSPRTAPAQPAPPRQRRTPLATLRHHRRGGVRRWAGRAACAALPGAHPLTATASFIGLFPNCGGPAAVAR